MVDGFVALGAAAAVEQFTKSAFKCLSKIIELGRRMHKQPEYITNTIKTLQLLQNIQQEIKASTASQNVTKACNSHTECVNELLAALEEIDRLPSDSRGKIARKAVDSMLHENDIKSKMARLDSIGQHIMLALLSTIAGAMRETVKSTMEESLKTNALSRSVNAAASDIPSDQSGVDMFLRELCVEKPQDIRQRLIKAKGNRVNGTCSWVLKHEAYQSWLAGTEQGLWINGDTGKGKTMTSIFLSQELERYTAESGGVLLYFFCDSQFEKRRTQLGFIQSLVHQLCLARPPLAFHCLTEYQRYGGNAAISTETLWRCAKNMLKSLEKEPVFVLIDGLDECDAESVVELCQELASLNALSPDEQQKVRPIIISRLLDDKCKRYLAKFSVLQLNDATEDVGRDLSTFVHSRVNDIAREKHYDDALRRRVLAAILQNSEGTFLWAGFVLHDLEEEKTVDVERCLAKLPSRLDDIYGRILQRIPEDKTAVIKQILKWVVLAVRPLTVPELAAAISTGPGETPPTVELITARIGLCRHLLSISQDVVKLVHQSARDYLTSGAQLSTMPRRFNLNVQQAHSEIAQLCVSKLADRLKTAKFSDVFNITSSPAQIVISPTLEPIIGYSIEYWERHARLSDGWSPTHDSFVSTFLETKSCRNWVQLFHEAHRIPCPEKVLLESEVHLASFLGLESIVRASINKRRFNVNWLLPINHPDSHLACAGLLGGHTAIVKVLVKELGASVGKVSARSAFFSSPIHIAAATNNVPALELLLDKRTDTVNRADDKGWTPLHHAALLDHVEACQYLISKGAHVESLDDAHHTPLYYAALPAYAGIFLSEYRMSRDYNHFVEIFPTITTATMLEGGHPRKTSAVQVLLDAKANPNPAPGLVGSTTPLHNSIKHGHVQEVKALVCAGADITVKDGEGRNALYTMTLGDNRKATGEAIASFLVGAGANLDPERERERPFMLDAILAENMSLANLALGKALGKHTDLRYIDDYGRSFLYYAADTRCEEIVEVLMDAGVGINRVTALLPVAAKNGHWKLCKHILKGNAQPEIGDDFVWNLTIQSLTADYDPSLVNTMIEAGASLNEDSWLFGAPLIMAVVLGSHEVVVDLIAEGADVNSQFHDTSALEFALSIEHGPIVKSLLAAGARTVSGISPLGYGSVFGLRTMVGFLISQEGANPNKRTGKGYTPIEMASAMGHERVVAELVRAGADAMVSSSTIMALSEAASNDNDEIALMPLGDYGAHPNFKIRQTANLLHKFGLRW